MRTIFLILAAFGLAACGGTDQLITGPKVVVTERIASHFSSIEVLEVSLPNYAAGDEVAIEEDSRLVLSNALWADDPTRAVTLSLTRNLKEITGARVASEPWPFDDTAAARVDVRVEQLLVADGALVLSGQYFVADLEGQGRDHSHLFNLRAPLAENSAEAAANGRAELFSKLAQAIARDAL